MKNFGAREEAAVDGGLEGGEELVQPDGMKLFDSTAHAHRHDVQ